MELLLGRCSEPSVQREQQALLLRGQLGSYGRDAILEREKQFLAFSNTADTLHFHVERTYVLTQKRTPLMDYARVMYNRRVAYLWRRVRYVAVKGARITLRREEFDELRFQPGGSGWLAARESFNAHANA